jgi:hypothetical protein
MYINSLKGAISVKKPLDIVQVGANDGKYNDPIYDFVKSHKESTNIILVEPVQTVIPYLKNNYSFHPSSKIVNKAITNQKSSSIRLYGVDQEYWDEINAGYGEDWPDYRVPTGITTTEKDRILRWVSENIKTDDEPENMIKPFDVQTIQPKSLINTSEIIDNIQLLQVDAEGMDDQIVYQFFKSGLYPDIVNIENVHMDQNKKEKYDQKMENEGYNVYNYTSREKLALREDVIE